MSHFKFTLHTGCPILVYIRVLFLVYIQGVLFLFYIRGVPFLVYIQGVPFLVYIRGVPFLVYIRVSFLVYIQGVTRNRNKNYRDTHLNIWKANTIIYLMYLTSFCPSIIALHHKND